MLIFSERAARRDMDLLTRNERRYVHGSSPETERRREEEWRARFPRYEDLDIEDVVLERNDSYEIPDKTNTSER